MRKITIVGIIFVGFILLSASSIMETSSRQEVKSQNIQPLNSSWLDGWVYRKSHHIIGSIVGSQVNYPIPINVHYDNGFDYDADVYLSGKCQSDFGDVRFTDSTGANLLDYWIDLKVNGVSALFWVEVPYIPQSPNASTIYVYYGNPNATSESNSAWTMNLQNDFEDNTNQSWTISWLSHVAWDGVTQSQPFEGNYCRSAGRIYGSNGAGTRDFYDGFQKSIYLTTGTYWIQGAAAHMTQDSYKFPQDIRLKYDGVSVDTVTNPQTSWHLLSGNITVTDSHLAMFNIQFHLYTSTQLAYGSAGYSMDDVIIRKWCDPEPTHGTWEPEETSSDQTLPQIFSVDWEPTSPPPFVSSVHPRHGEPVFVHANASDEPGGSGLASVELHYSISGGEWWHVLMTYNQTSRLWATIVPGQPGNVTVELFVSVRDHASNLETSEIFSYEVQYLIVGDLNGDGIVDIFDIVRAAGHYGESW